MSIFISPQDYMMMASECEQIIYEICGHEYKMWCKRDKIEQAQEIIDKIKPLIEKVADKNKLLSFDRILLIFLIDFLAKDKDFQISDKKEQKTIKDQSEFDKLLIQEKESLTNEFIAILQQINQALDE